LKAKTATSNRTHPEALLARSSFRGLPLCLLLLFLSVHFSSTALAANPSKLKPTDPYALIFGTVWGPDDRPVYGVKVKIRRASDKKAKWELYSDHAGEFAQRVPAGEADYVIWADLKGVKTTDGQTFHLAQEVNIHVQYDERVDMSLHLTH
jgi:hypothetical protein